jgi:hypothetical protein
MVGDAEEGVSRRSSAPRQGDDSVQLLRGDGRERATLAAPDAIQRPGDPRGVSNVFSLNLERTAV